MTASLSSYDFIDQLQALPFVEAIWLFGSRSRGDADPRSDVDLAILYPAADDADWQQVLSIIEEADTLLEIDSIRYDKLTDQKLLDETKQSHKVLYHKGDQ